MKYFVSLLVSSLLLFRALPAAADPLLQQHDRVALCGDATPPGIACSVYLEDYLIACQSLDLGDMAAFGGTGETAQGFCNRLDSALSSFKPALVLTDFGASEAGAKPLDTDTADGYRKAQISMIDALKRMGARVIVIGSPECVDPLDYPQGSDEATGRNKNLAELAGIDKEVAAKEGVVYADVFGATMAAMTKGKALYGDTYAFARGDRSNPCGLVMAYAFLKALGVSGDIGSVTLPDFATGRVKSSRGQWIGYQDHALSIESWQFPFWWYPGNSRPATPSIMKCVPFDDELNRYILTVKNLPSPRTKITWGNEDHDFTAEQLAAGINLPKEFSRTPFSDLFDNLTHCVYDQQQLNRAATDPGAAKWNAALQSTISDLVHVIRHTQRQIINIQPLVEVERQPAGPIPVIIDTDLDSDVDDVGALTLLNDFMDQGEAKLIACIHDTSNQQLSSGATIQAINAYYGHPSIPIGQSFAGTHPMTSVLLPAPPDGYQKVPGPDNSSYTLKIHQRFDPDFPNDDKLPAGVDVYRKALASAADGSVVICSVGTMENIQDLILSQPDSVSSLNGLDLVRKKVRELVIMANTEPQDHYLLSKWPTKIMWTTYVGSNIGTGPTLLNTPESNPVRMAYDLFGVLHTGRQSWDLTAAWLAVRGPGYVFDVVAGRPQYINDITHSPAGPYPNECSVTIRMPYPDVSKLIGAELARPPTK